MTIQIVECRDGTFDTGRPFDVPTPKPRNVQTLYEAVCDARLLQQQRYAPIEIVVGPYKALLQ